MHKTSRDLPIRSNHIRARKLCSERLEGRWLLAADLSFSEPVLYPTGDNPEQIAVADVDGDGNADLVTANFFSNDVSILLGNGDGTFQKESIHRASISPVAVAVADLNDDEILDLSVANLDDDSVSVLIGLGDNSFDTRTDYATGVFPQSVTVGDLDNDGRQDLIVAHTGLPDEPGGVSILFGTEFGTFAPATEVAGDLRPSVAEVVDLNGDNNLDIVLANGFPFVPGNDDVAVLLGKGDGSFETPARYPIVDGETPIEIAVADFNGDQILDVASVNSSSENVAVLMGVGDGTLAEAVTYDVLGVGFSASITSGDMDGDGSSDLVITTDQSIAVLVNVGDGTFADPVGVPIFGGPSWVALGDFNGDDRLDVAAVVQANRPQDSVVAVSLNAGAGDLNSDGLSNAADIDALYAAIVEGNNEPIFDLNEDGTLTSDDVLFLLENSFGTNLGDANLDGAVNFSDFLVLSANLNATEASWSDGDFDGDGEVTFADFLLLSNNFDTPV